MKRVQSKSMKFMNRKDLLVPKKDCVRWPLVSVVANTTLNKKSGTSTVHHFTSMIFVRSFKLPPPQKTYSIFELPKSSSKRSSKSGRGSLTSRIILRS